MASSLFGGNIKDYGGEDTSRRWPVDATPPHPDDPRPVEVSITSWVGTSPGARHTYLEIKEADNPVWDEEAGGWRKCWDDRRMKGAYIHLDVYNAAQAWKIARSIIKIMGFDGPGYRLSFRVPDSLHRNATAYQRRRRSGD